MYLRVFRQMTPTIEATMKADLSRRFKDNFGKLVDFAEKGRNPDGELLSLRVHVEGQALRVHVDGQAVRQERVEGAEDAHGYQEGGGDRVSNDPMGGNWQSQPKKVVSSLDKKLSNHCKNPLRLD